ncbi:MAG: DNA mismatch repair protein MutS, partial [Clostridia bacterium]|nr:DNA mismatch repair protein MutS [Clostridia bacterium]
LEENITKNDRRELPTFTEYLDKHFNVQTAENLLLKQFKTQSLKAFDIDNLPNCIASCGALIQYFFETQKRSLNHIDKVKLVNYSNYMHIDFVSRKNLELTKNARDGGKTGTLLWYLDKTKTSMGARLLKKFIDEPLQKIEEIKLRQDGVEELLNNIIKREAIAKTLFNVKDLERLCGRISYNTLTPKDCITIKNSLLVLPTLKSLLQNTNSKVLKAIHNGISTHQNVIDLIERAINENDGNTATNLKEVGFINNGYSPELDELRNSAINGRSWILQLEKKEIEETKIKNLKIAYNRVFGYFIDVPNSQKNLVPFRYQRKQTLTSSERYTTEELTNLEEQIIGAEDKSLKLEQQLFVDLREKLLAFIPEIKETSTFIGYLDVLCSLAVVAAKNNLVKPEIVSEDEDLVITDGKHPIVESIIKENFVPNNTLLDKNDNRTMVITGPNMAGKSTYMRQVAVIAIMAHIGSFVPAKQVQMPITDRIFTRIGATDDLALGQSTFMVEMTEVANILHNATPNSLILLDEIGRGTSTYDGLSIAWAVMDYISQNLICKTLFSTHYHELTELEVNLKGIKNYISNVHEVDGQIIFLRKIVRGGANKSFGIEVASLAGLPQSVILKAKSILKNLELADVNKENLGNMVSKIQTETEDLKISTEKMKSVAEQDVLDAIKEVVVEKITPFEAMSLIYDLKTKLENDKK